MAYATRADVFAFGLPASALSNPARSVQVNTTLDQITLDMHGLEDGTAVKFRADAGGALPAGLAEGTTVYTRDCEDSTFKVAATLGGAAIDLTGSPARVVLIVPLDFDAAIAFGEAVINDSVPAHLVPLDPVPDIAKITCAELAAQKLLAGKAGSATLTAMIDAAQKRLARWAKNAPVRGAGTPPGSAQLATISGVPATAALYSCTGWGRFGGTE
jgi:hypothetical protein